MTWGSGRLFDCGLRIARHGGATPCRHRICDCEMRAGTVAIPLDPVLPDAYSLGRHGSGSARVELGRNTPRSNTNRHVRPAARTPASTDAGGTTSLCVAEIFCFPSSPPQGEHVDQTRHAPPAGTNTLNSPCRGTMDHRYSPYKTCVSCDRSPGDFAAIRGSSRPMLMVLSHSRSPSTPVGKSRPS